jgi:hypothetical protein
MMTVIRHMHHVSGCADINLSRNMVFFYEKLQVCLPEKKLFLILSIFFSMATQNLKSFPFKLKPSKKDS